MQSNKQTKDPIDAIYTRDGPTVSFNPEHLHFVLTVYYDLLFYGIT